MLHLGNNISGVIFLKKKKQSKNSKRYSATDSSDIVEELNAVSAMDFTGLIPANPDFYSEENYEEIMPQGFAENQA